MRLLFFATILFLGSCTITKRVHRPGFNVEWNKKYSSQNTFESKNSDSVVRIVHEHEKQQLASAKNDSIISPNDISVDTEEIFDTEKAKPHDRTAFNPSFISLKNQSRHESQIQQFSKVLKKYTEPTEPEMKNESYYTTMGILSFLLIVVLAIVALTTVRSSAVMYTAGIAMCGIPLLFVYMIRCFRTAKEIRATKPAKPIEIKPEPKPEIKGEIEPKKEIPVEKTSKSIGKPENDTVAIFSFILFLFSILLAFALPFLGLLLFLLSLILAIYSLSRKTINGKPLKYRGLAYIPVIFTLVFLILSIVALVVVISF
jgi:hypothetical protein